MVFKLRIVIFVESFILLQTENENYLKIITFEFYS